MLGPFGDLAGVLSGLALVLDGRGADALPWVERTIESARALDAPPAGAAAAALRAEITGDVTGLPPAPASAGSVEEALILRAHAAPGRHLGPRRPAPVRARTRPCRACSSGWRRSPPACDRGASPQWVADAARPAKTS